MRKIAAFFIMLVLFIATFLSTRVASETSIAPSDNQVVALQLNSTLWGIRQALSGQPGTYVMARGGDLLFIWQIKDAWVFSGVNVEKAQAMHELAAIWKGNVVNVKTMSELVSWLEENGWKVVPTAGLPKATQMYISASLESAASFSPTFLILPAGMFLPSSELEKYQLIEVWQ